MLSPSRVACVPCERTREWKSSSATRRLKLNSPVYVQFPARKRSVAQARVLNAVPQIHQSFHFLPGVCGAAGVCLASLALFMGYYHRNQTQGAVLAVCAFTLPYLATWFWFRLTRPTQSAGLLQLCGPTAMIAVAVYGFLMWWHARQSSLTVESLSTQVVEDDYGMPASRWQQQIVRISTAIGIILILLVLVSALASRN